MRRWQMVLVAVAVTGLVGWALWQLTHQPGQRSCADVAITEAPIERTAEAAVATFVRSQGGDPAEWREGDDGWAPRTDDAQAAYRSLSVARVAGGWAVTGGCV